jgi:hypothetical protein
MDGPLSLRERVRVRAVSERERPPHLPLSQRERGALLCHKLFQIAKLDNLGYVCR